MGTAEMPGNGIATPSASHSCNTSQQGKALMTRHRRCQTHVKGCAPVEVGGPPRHAGRAGEPVHGVILSLCDRTAGTVGLRDEQQDSRPDWLGPHTAASAKPHLSSFLPSCVHRWNHNYGCFCVYSCMNLALGFSALPQGIQLGCWYQLCDNRRHSGSTLRLAPQAPVTQRHLDFRNPVLTAALRRPSSEPLGCQDGEQEPADGDQLGIQLPEVQHLQVGALSLTAAARRPCGAHRRHGQQPSERHRVSVRRGAGEDIGTDGSRGIQTSALQTWAADDAANLTRICTHLLLISSVSSSRTQSRFLYASL